MKKWVLRSLYFVFFVLLLLIVQYGYRGTPLEFEELSFSMNDFDSITDELICMSMSEEQITTYEEYTELLVHCPITIKNDLTAEYFTKNTLAIYIYDVPNKQITHFYDYAFMINDTEIINYREKSDTHDDLYMYLIYASRGEFETEYILFDKVK